jgi:Rhodopirellula transposase DDE domain/Methyltransferase domain
VGRRAVDFATLSEPGNCRDYFTVEHRLGVDQGDRLLDVACGSGLAIELARLRGAERAGIDASPRLVAVARDRNPDSDIRVGDMHALPWPDSSFDVATSTMNWRGRPLTSHEVIVHTIAATTTRTGLRVHAELDTSACGTGIKVSDRQMGALPLTRHDWHGDWNYTLRPQPYDPDSGAPDPFDQPSPDLAWLCHPALTGLPAREWDALIATLMTLHGQQREEGLNARRGHRPRLAAPGRHRRLVQHPARNDQQAHPRHPPAPGPGRIHHPARPAPARQPGRSLQARGHRRHHDCVKDQDGVLMICAFLTPRH